MQKALLILLCILPLQVNADTFLGSGDVMGRDLDIPGVGWVGHVGLAYETAITPPFVPVAHQVIEVLNENPVIQINSVQNFKSKSKYWGSRYGVLDDHDRHEMCAQIIKILREAASQMGFCPTYTATAQYKPGTSTSCAVFRCDTFVYHIFNAGAGVKLVKDGDAILPRIVYFTFPKENDPEVNRTEYKNISRFNINELNSMPAQKLSKMSSEDFMIFINAPLDKLSREGINNMWKLAQDPVLSTEKRILLMDKLGFIGKPDMLSSFTKYYFKINDNKIKSMLLRSTLIIYQTYSNLGKYPNEKDILRRFYMQLLDTKLTDNDASIVIRGFIQLNNVDVVIKYVDQLNKVFNKPEVKPDSYSSIGLKIELAFKSKELEKIYIPNIISILKKKNNTQIEYLFNQAIVRRLLKEGLNTLEPQSKKEILGYLDSVGYKYKTPENETEFGMLLPFYGTWLEALALISSSSLDDASQFIAKFIADQKSSIQIVYVSGLSNSDYLKKAFNTYPSLINFKNQNKDIYLNSVGSRGN